MKLYHKVKALLLCGAMMVGGSALITSCDDDKDPEVYIEASQTIFEIDAAGLDAGR